MIPSWAALAALAVALAWPVPILLAKTKWTARAPATALVVWQAIALAGGLSMIGALLTYGLEPFGGNLLDSLFGLAHGIRTSSLPIGASFPQMFALSGAILLGVHLLLNLALTLARAERSRARHRQLVALLSSPLPSPAGVANSRTSNTRLINHAAPVAYCLPGTTSSVTVLSAGLLDLLDDQQLQAVLVHEQTHAFQRHHLVLLAFRAWRASLPWFPIATRAEEAVGILIEMLADDNARRAVGDEVLADAIVRVSSAFPEDETEPASEAHSALSANGLAATSRLARLVDGPAPLPIATRAVAIGCAIALLVVPTLLLVGPAIVAG